MLSGQSGISLPSVLPTADKNIPVGEVKLTNQQLKDLIRVRIQPECDSTAGWQPAYPLKRLFTEVIIVLNPSTNIADKVEFFEPNSDHTTIVFSNVRFEQ